MYGPWQGSRNMAWAKCKIFLEGLFISNNINTNLNKNFLTYQTVIFIFSNFYEKQFEKIRTPKMAQGRLPSPNLYTIS